MRVSLTLKPDSRSDFGVQTHWDSTGARVQFIQPGETLASCYFVSSYPPTVAVFHLLELNLFLNNLLEMQPKC